MKKENLSKKGPLLESEYVIKSRELLASDEGFDLTGDGIPNNSLAF